MIFVSDAFAQNDRAKSVRFYPKSSAQNDRAEMHPGFSERSHTKRPGKNVRFYPKSFAQNDRAEMQRIEGAARAVVPCGLLFKRNYCSAVDQVVPLKDAVHFLAESANEKLTVPFVATV